MTKSKLKKLRTSFLVANMIRTKKVRMTIDFLLISVTIGVCESSRKIKKNQNRDRETIESSRT